MARDHARRGQEPPHSPRARRARRRSAAAREDLDWSAATRHACQGRVAAAHGRRSPHGMTAYREWQLMPVEAAGKQYLLATKPGVFAYGRTDPSTLMLAVHATVDAGGVMVHLNCGGGL